MTFLFQGQVLLKILFFDFEGFINLKKLDIINKNLKNLIPKIFIRKLKGRS